MPGPFAITPSSSTVPLDAKRTGTVTFTVKNTTRMRLRGVARVIATPPESVGWHSVIVPPVDPSPVQPTTPPPPISTAPVDPLMRDFAPEGTQVYTVQTTIPATAVSGEYKFRLIVSNQANPDDEFTESAEVSFSVAPAPPPKPPSKFPFWIIPVIIVLLVVVGGAILLLTRQADPDPAVDLSIASAIDNDTGDNVFTNPNILTYAGGDIALQLLVTFQDADGWSLVPVEVEGWTVGLDGDENFTISEDALEAADGNVQATISFFIAPEGGAAEQEMVITVQRKTSDLKQEIRLILRPSP